MAKKVFLIILSFLMLFGVVGCTSAPPVLATFPTPAQESIDEAILRWNFIEKYLENMPSLENQYVAKGIDIAIVNENIAVTKNYFKGYGDNIDSLVERFYNLNQKKSVGRGIIESNGKFTIMIPAEFQKYFFVKGVGFDQWRHDYPDIQISDTFSTVAYDLETGLALIYRGSHAGETNGRIYLMKWEKKDEYSNNKTLTEIASQDCKKYITAIPATTTTTKVTTTPTDTFTSVKPAKPNDIENEIFLKMIAYHYELYYSGQYLGGRENIRVGLPVNEYAYRDNLKEYYQKLNYNLDKSVDRFFAINTDMKIVTVDGSPKDGYYFVPNESIDKYFQDGGGGYSQWQHDNPGVVYRLQLSIPAYDPKTGLVIVTISTYDGPTYGGAHIYLMRYKDGVLTKIDSHLLWIS